MVKELTLFAESVYERDFFMRICFIFYDMQEFGGLEEYAVALARGLKNEMHQQVSVISTAWVLPDNQYLLRLKEDGISVVQLPKWVSLAVSDWETKEKILARVMWLLTPFVYMLGTMLSLLKRRPWRQSVTSVRNWLQGKLMDHVIGPDRREPLVRLLLKWWQIRWHPDIFHIQGYTTNLLFVIEWAFANGVPTVYEEHQTPDPQFDWWQGFHHIINKADTVVAVSDKSAEGLREVCGVTRPIVVRNPLLSDPKASGWEKQILTQNDERSLVVTTVARLYVTKGLVYLLDAIVKVREKHPDTQFKVYGDGELHHELLAYAAQLGLDGEQIFVGAFDHRDLNGIMDKTDIFALSSILEGQPLAIVEAMAYGCPIVTTAVGGIAELIQEDVNGLLCYPADPDCLAQKICTLIEDPELRNRLGQAARLSYEKGAYQPVAVSKHFKNIYQGVLEAEPWSA